MNPQIILEIIKLSLEITLEVIRGIPIAQREALWMAHEKRLEFWQNLFSKMGNPNAPPPIVVTPPKVAA